MNELIAALLLRAARLDDAWDLRRTCWPDRPLEHVLTLLERSEALRGARRGLGAVAACEGAPCAFGMLTLWRGGAEISDVCVAASRRSRGIGSELIGYLTDAARALGVERLEIGVALANPRALALYQRLGFHDDRLIELDLGAGPQPVLYLVKRLYAASYRSSSSISPL